MFRRDVDAIRDDLAEGGWIEQVGGEDRRLAMMERRHGVERMREDGKTVFDGGVAYRIRRCGMPRREHDATPSQFLGGARGAVDLGRHRDATAAGRPQI